MAPRFVKFGRLACGASFFALACPVAVLGQVQVSAPVPAAEEAAAPSASSAIEDIVVTARFREENPISTPVVVSAVGKSEIERRGIVSLDDLTGVVPQLMIAPTSGSTGAIIAIRGISVGDANDFGEQAVSFNIDGVQLARATLRRLSEVDIQQVEVLKGPQALFFGKNSPAGVISIRTADPGQDFEGRVNLGYEPIAREARIDGYVSGPITENVGARLALFGSRMSGFLKNVAPRTQELGPSRKRSPNERDYGGRLTLKGDWGDLTARFKFAYSMFKTSGKTSNLQVIACPIDPLTGRSEVSPLDDCKPNDERYLLDRVPAASTSVIPELYTNQGPSFRNPSVLSSFELGYNAGPVKLTSITGLYDSRFTSVGNFAPFDISNPILQTSADRFTDREYSQEFRAVSDLDGPFNFVAGAYYGHSDLSSERVTLTGPAAVILIPRFLVKQRGSAMSAMAQGIYAITDKLELSGGARFSYERKRFRAFTPSPNTAAGAQRYRSDLVEVVNVKPKDSWKDLSPEATLTYRPSDTLTVFGSYKRGFLSGGYNAGQGPAFTADRTYDPQKIKGFEGGVKAALFDRKLRTNFAIYSYKIDDLQVSTLAPLNIGGIPTFATNLVNASTATSKGAEFDAQFRATQELTLRTAIAYNRTKYGDFTASCYVGQTIAQGCNLLPNATGTAFQAQNLSNQPLVRAPEWNIQTGAAYTVDVGTDRRLTFSSDATYSSSFFAATSNKPDSLTKSFWLLDAGVNYTDNASGLSFAIIGKNLTNKFINYRSSDLGRTGRGTGTNSPTALTSVTVGNPDRGREIMFRVGIQFDKLGGR